jgi:hypothetical protein
MQVFKGWFFILCKRNLWKLSKDCEVLWLLFYRWGRPIRLKLDKCRPRGTHCLGSRSQLMLVTLSLRTREERFTATVCRVLYFLFNFSYHFCFLKHVEMTRLIIFCTYFFFFFDSSHHLFIHQCQDLTNPYRPTW